VIKSLDFSDDGRFPAVVEVRLGSGHKFACAATDEEAQRIIDLCTEAAMSDEKGAPA